MNDLTVFDYNGSAVRTVQKGTEVWWVLTDVCKVLEIANSRNAAARLDADEKGVHFTDTLGGQQNITIINEPGLYSLILRSNKPEAKAFKRWVTHEVLPSIRSNGFYASQEYDKIIQFDDENKRNRVIERDKRSNKWHVHVGYFHAENGKSQHDELTDEDKKLLEKVKNIWHNK